MDLNDPAHIGHSNYLIDTFGWRAERVENPVAPLDDMVIQELIKHYESNDKEACGFITNYNEVVLVQNSHLDPVNNFYMDQHDASAAIDYIYDECDSQIMGIFHTHANNYPWPSPRDIRGWPKLELGWRYFLVTREAVSEWALVHD